MSSKREKEESARLCEQAIELVITRMKGKRRKSGDKPMAVHSLRVGFILERAGEPVHVLTAGFLHDLVEDAEVSWGELSQLFGEEIATLVMACTHNLELHKKDRYAAQNDLFKRATAHGRDAIAIKVADVSDNVTSIHNLSVPRQREMLIRAQKWAKLGEHFLGPTHGLTAQLHRRLERAQEVVPAS